MIAPEQEPVTPYVVPPGCFRLRRQMAVSWFDLRQLLATASKTVAATIVGSMSGRRELMAALDPPGPGASIAFESVADCDEYWWDYLADTGDGWNATMSVAWLLGRDALVLRDDNAPTAQRIPEGQAEHMSSPEAGTIILQRGDLLVAGGDQVYPTASPDSYQYRFNDPLACARYSQTPSRTILAIPGNHDWYDGLTSFIRLFCQKGNAQRWFGAWRTQQRRSYFALRLPHGWWLWGTDTALGDDLDPPQYDYFREAANQLREGERVILCIPGPHWEMEERKDQPEAAEDRQLKNKLRIIIELAEKGGSASVPLILTGDLHYYARFEERAAEAHGQHRHYLICGGGGAFGLGTLNVPDRISVGQRRAASVEASLFPSPEESVDLRRGVWAFSFRNPGFTALLMAIQLIALWLINAVPVDAASDGWIGYAMRTNLGDFLSSVAQAALYPALFLGTTALIAGFAAFGISGKPRVLGSRVAGLVGAVHAAAQIVGSVSLFWLCAQAVHGAFEGSPLAGAENWIAVLLAAPVQYLFCGFLFGGYLFVTHKSLRMHDQEVFSAQGIEDYRSFLRIRITSEALAIFPIGLRKVARRWRAAPHVGVFDGDSAKETDRPLGWREDLWTPGGCQRIVDPIAPLEPHLIEQPIIIAGRGQA